MNFSCESKGLGHRFQNKFLFRNLSFSMERGRIVLVTGSNGSGKSTLLRIVSGAMEPGEGVVEFQENGESIEISDVWEKIAFVAPYQELPEELTLSELIAFQEGMQGKKLKDTLYSELVEIFGFGNHLEKIIRIYSTGMKQKARFILGLGSSRPIWILDEPTSNLDSDSISIFWDFVQRHKSQRLILVASNDPSEFGNMAERIDLSKS